MPNIYVREDVLLDRLAMQLASDPHRSDGDVEPSTVNQIVARLRTQSKVIVYGEGNWTLVPAKLTVPYVADDLSGLDRHGVILCPRGDLTTTYTVFASRFG